VGVSLLTDNAPRRIWIQISDDPDHHDEPWPESMGEVTWCDESVMCCEVEYVRADLANEYPQVTIPGLQPISNAAGSMLELARREGWNAAIEAVKRLNPDAELIDADDAQT
jgi:hypothetical protein